jgi:hypothetical protein
MVDATANDVLYGYRYWDDAGFPHTGKLKLTGTAKPEQVVSGETFYNTDAHTIETGTMTTSGGGTRTVYVNKNKELLEDSLALNAVLLIQKQKEKNKP